MLEKLQQRPIGAVIDRRCAAECAQLASCAMLTKATTHHAMPTCAALAALAFAFPAQAALAAVEVGSSISGLDREMSCGVQLCVTVQDTLPGRLTRVPILRTADDNPVSRGVIVRWRVRGEGTFWIAPVAYDGDDSIVAAPEGSTPRTADSLSTVSWFPTRVPVVTGKSIALYLTAGSRVARRIDVLGADVDVWGPDVPPVGVARERDHAWDVGWNVVVEADNDGDSHGDETQDKCPTNPATQAACPRPPSPSPPGPISPQPDTSPPIISNARVRQGRLRLTLSEAARLEVTLARKRGGAYRRVRAITRLARAGDVAMRLRKRRRLERARYRVVIRAVDAAGNRSASARVRFRVRTRSMRR